MVPSSLRSSLSLSLILSLSLSRQIEDSKRSVQYETRRFVAKLELELELELGGKISRPLNSDTLDEELALGEDVQSR
ncbi:hypothetical protein BPAE_0260g00080 [Botrytis paeoniae]|uniref:Uncharacterized protein n=1 Tax=Botrytis paeoniae TaxID=278948 RepID=A0A4Z1F8G9_9HELO|nr:hypothetical protein BPAE_0260g00080 [Botrytis paeoniae]